LLRRLGILTRYSETGKPISHYDEEEEEEANQKPYQEIVGRLNYAATATRPDMALAVGNLGRFAADPAGRHMRMAIRVMRYLKKTACYRLVLGDQNGKEGVSESITLNSDSGFAGDPNSLRSATGMTIQDRYGSIVAWHSKKQSITAKSTADAEFTVTATSTDEAVLLYKIDIELHTLPGVHRKSYIPLRVYSDNQANVLNANTGTHHTWSKTVAVKFPWLFDQVNAGTIVISHI